MSSIIQTRIDDKSKAEAEAIFRQMGMSLSDGIRIFIYQVLNERALPFQPRVPVFRDEVIEAAQRARDYIDGKNRENFKKFETVDDAMADLLSEED
jgi:DNA-damage-inducible protein J|nr:MAG TPA: addiction module antitoxin [Caudoviricetes sp.]